VLDGAVAVAEPDDVLAIRLFVVSALALLAAVFAVPLGVAAAGALAWALPAKVDEETAIGVVALVAAGR